MIVFNAFALPVVIVSTMAAASVGRRELEPNLHHHATTAHVAFQLGTGPVDPDRCRIVSTPAGDHQRQRLGFLWGEICILRFYSNGGQRR